MQIEVKEIEYGKLLINYLAENEDITEKKAEVLKAFRKAPVKGHRKGKTNQKAIELQYRDQIAESLKRALAENAYHDTIFEKKIRPYGTPKFNSLILAGNKFTCEFEVMVKPDFDLCDFRSFELIKPHEEITFEENVQHMLQELRIRFGTVTPYTETDFIQIGDSIIVDYEGSIDGMKIDRLTAVGEMLTIGKSNLVDFDNSLIGLKVGESREFDLIVPPNGLPSYVGKTIHFKVSVSMGSKNEPCPLNDELAARMGRASFDELRQAVNMQVSSTMQQTLKGKLNEIVANRLVNEIVFRVPEWLVESEAKFIAHNSKMEWDTLQDVDKMQYSTMAEKNVRLALILDRIRDFEPESVLTDQEIFTIIRDNIAKSGKDVDETIKEISKNGYLQVLASRIKDEHTLNFVCMNVKFKE